MSENRGSRQPQRYCRNCGAELRPGTAFCTSCGEPLGSADQNASNSGRTYSRTGRSLGSSLPGVVRSIADGCKSIAEDPRVAWVLVSACAVLGLLVLLRSAARPILQLLGPSVFLFPLLAIAAATLLLTVGVGNTGHTRTMKSVVAVAAVFYFSVGLFRAVLEIVPLSAARNVVGITLLAFAALGALLVAESRGFRNTAQPRSTVRRAAANCGRWVGGWSTRRKTLSLGGVALVLLLVLSAYAFVLSATDAAAPVAALAVRVGRRKTWKPAGYAVMGSVVLTLTFGIVSDALYGTGTGLEITTNAGGEERLKEETNGESGEDPAYTTPASEEDVRELFSPETSNASNDPVEVYLVEDYPYLASGYLLVNETSDGRFFHAYDWQPFLYASGEVLPDGEMYLLGSRVGNLDYFRYACTYNDDDPRGGMTSMQEECGFSLEQ
jgi:hypothetical protein